MPTTTIGTDVGALRAFIRGVEDLGFEHVIAYDHVLGGPHEDRRAPLTGPYTEKDDFHEPFTFFAWAAAFTTQLRLFPSVIVAPQRQTALMAKQAVELHNLSSGRLRLGIGVGWNWVEFDALNADFERRGAVIEEQVAVIYAVTTGFLDSLDTGKVRAWEKGFLEYLRAQFPQILDGMRSSKALAKDAEAELKRAIEQYTKSFVA